MEFFKSLADKFLDFFNVGRAISIIIPGSLVAIVLLMLLSLAVFPPAGAGTTASSAEKGARQEKKGFASPSSGKVEQDKKFDNRSNHQVGAKVATPAKKTDLSSPGNPADPNTSKPLNKLSEQIAGDFLRVTKHYWIILLLALIIGILLYEIGSVIIAAWPDKAVTKMYSFKEKEKGDQTLEFEEGKKEAEVGLIYFAPFLKAEFTGKENYYSFLITEYYRFLEFSAVMPMAVLMASLLALIYYKNACDLTKTTCSPEVITVTILVVPLAVFLFYLLVFAKVIEGYRKKTRELIRGVVDATNKEIK